MNRVHLTRLATLGCTAARLHGALRAHWLVPVLAVTTLLTVFADTGLSQITPGPVPPPQGEYGDDLYFGHRAYVDPVHGVDGPTPEARLAQVDDPSQAFKTLQAAIDTLSETLILQYPTSPPTSHSVQGLVYALPGIYGPHGPGSSGESLPIYLRDRVHVKGVGANRCIIRGAGVTNTQAFWPDAPTATSTRIWKEVLVDMRLVNACAGSVVDPNMAPPWCDGVQDTQEVFSGFTLQGGDVQIYTNSRSARQEQRVTITNCVFDMRDGYLADPEEPSSVVAGPYFGIMLVKGLFPNEPGYIDQKFLIANNTFVMAQWGLSGATEQWVHTAQPGAVGVIDVTETFCGGAGDCDETLRGVGNAGLINNLFRTRPGATHFHEAFLGIDESDTLVQLDSSGAFVQTNVFATNRAGQGGGNGTFYSLAVNSTLQVPAVPSEKIPAVWGCGASTETKNEACGVPGPSCPPASCTAAALPSPVVALYDGSGSEYDPGFIGEYLSVSIPGLASYVDWRLLPGSDSTSSPMKDRGYLPPNGQPIVMKNGTSFPLIVFDELDPFEWDGEGYGNPRRVDGSPDVGFDEIHLVNMAGSYGNYSSSHNVAGALNPAAPQGTTNRYLFFRTTAGGVTVVDSNEIVINGAQATPHVHPIAWYQPPATLDTPAKNTALPAGFRKKYISFRATPPAPWSETFSQFTNLHNYLPLGGLAANSVSFGRLTVISDDECAGGSSCAESYFNTQVVYKTDSSPSGTEMIRSNLQAEYR